MELAKKYLQESPTKRSIRNDKHRLDVIAPRFNRTQLEHLTAQEIRDVLDQLQKERKFSDHTWNHYHATVRKVINWLKNQGYSGPRISGQAIS
jgi:site-specific recombinase XerD